jgi:hypothetical protein
MPLDLFHQYSTAEPLLRGMPQWVGDMDAMRIASYNMYEQIYWNIPEAFDLVIRGSDTKPIYIPAAKKIVETLHRYLAKGMEVIPDPNANTADDAMNVLLDMFKRERLYSKFNAAKRYGIIRGDWLIHMYADPERSEGNRISVFFIDPASYFPIYNEDNVDEIIGCHLVEHWEMDDGTFIRRLTYRKETESGGPSPITVTDQLFEVDDWGGPGQEGDGEPVRTLQPPFTLPAPIDQLPVYHIQNFSEPGSIWGSSELRGFERLLTGINQGISDEDLTLAMEGLGVYATTAGKPYNEETGEEEEWNLGPARVVEVPEGSEFKRVTGVGSVAPYQDHLKYLEGWVDMATGTPDVAAGRVDVQVAESGVALTLEFAPLLDRAEEKELVITDRLTNWLYDLRKWFQAYEPSLAGSMEEARFIPNYGDKLPVNRKQKFDEILRLASHDPPIVSMQWVRNRLTELGFEFDDDTDMMDEILEEMEIIGKVKADAEGARIDRELDNMPDPSDNGQVADEVEV